VTPGELPEARAVHVHLEEMVKAVLGEVLLRDLVGLAGEVGVVTAVGEKDPLPIVGEVGAEEAALGPTLGEASQAGHLALEVLEDEDAPAGPRPPAVVLV